MVQLGKMRQLILGLGLALAFIQVVTVTGEDATQGDPVVAVALAPQLIAHQESVKAVDAADNPGSSVTITVGEKNGFVYTVNGYTRSPFKIAVSGEYHNDELYPARGFGRLFLVVDTGVAFYSLRPTGNILDVYVQNRFGNEFFYEILCPPGVGAYHLWEGQTNATAILVTGPSRSQVTGRKRSLDMDLDSELSPVVKERRRRRAVRQTL